MSGDLLVPEPDSSSKRGGSPTYCLARSLCARSGKDRSGRHRQPRGRGGAPWPDAISDSLGTQASPFPLTPSPVVRDSGSPRTGSYQGSRDKAGPGNHRKPSPAGGRAAVNRRRGGRAGKESPVPPCPPPPFPGGLHGAQ